MLEKPLEKKRKHARRIVLSVVVLLLIAVMIALLRGGGGKNAVSRESRLDFISSLGWEVVPDSEESRQVKIPDCSEGAMADYNALMQRGGYDLRPYEGRTVDQYSYEIKNYPGYSHTVYITLYVEKGRVIGGDIHSSALNGFMHELRARDPE